MTTAHTHDHDHPHTHPHAASEMRGAALALLNSLGRHAEGRHHVQFIMTASGFSGTTRR